MSLKLDHVNLNPNPPTAGNKLTIEAVGTLSQKLEKGAYVILQVSNVDLNCPVDEGKITITKDVDYQRRFLPEHTQSSPMHIPRMARSILSV
ncbi:hypothetical protein DID88_006275 [Monilinia fructigena]|uniref:MD-2-related lipid-recognition domain-containing protein n=1 Tax=Monilinia fructigena TaxID=38457 RepID=A0A395J270_9HELO|nr:hypothetical protein DID88_006275 [Monilinia fructigena]